MLMQVTVLIVKISVSLYNSINENVLGTSSGPSAYKTLAQKQVMLSNCDHMTVITQQSQMAA